MEAQWYQVQDNVLFQDNKSAILLKKNGNASAKQHMYEAHQYLVLLYY
jgi:hypothetical protein